MDNLSVDEILAYDARLRAQGQRLDGKPASPAHLRDRNARIVFFMSQHKAEQEAKPETEAAQSDDEQQ